MAESLLHGQRGGGSFGSASVSRCFSGHGNPAEVFLAAGPGWLHSGGSFRRPEDMRRVQQSEKLLGLFSFLVLPCNSFCLFPPCVLFSHLNFGEPQAASLSFSMWDTVGLLRSGSTECRDKVGSL